MDAGDNAWLLGRRIGKEREKRGLTAEELAAQSEVPVEFLYALEQGELPPKMMVEHLLELAEALNCEPYQLLR